MSASSDDHRLQRLLDVYGHVLRRAVTRAAPRHLGVDHDDVEQEARLRVWKALRRQVEVEQPASYLYRVAWTAAVDAVRRVRARREEALPAEDPHPAANGEAPPAAAPPRPSLVAEEPSPEERTLQRQEVRRVEGVLATLAESRRRAVGLHLQGHPTAEVAALLGWSQAKARNLVYRGLADLRSGLADIEAASRNGRERAVSRSAPAELAAPGEAGTPRQPAAPAQLAATAGAGASAKADEEESR